MYQTTYFVNTKPDLIRHLISLGGYTEGWGTYCEAWSYMYAETDNTNLKILAQANFSLTMLMYGKIDIGINHYGWTANDVLTLLKHLAFPAALLHKICITLIVAEPGNYAKYVLGYIGF